MCFIRLSAFTLLLRQLAQEAYVPQREESQAAAKALRDKLAALGEPATSFLVAIDDKVPTAAHVIYQITRSATQESHEAFDGVLAIPRASIETDPKAREEAQNKIRDTVLERIQCYQGGDRRQGNALLDRYEAEIKIFIKKHIGNGERTMALAFKKDSVWPDTADAGVDQQVQDFISKSGYTVKTVNMQIGMTGSSGRQVRPKGRDNTRSASGVAVPEVESAPKKLLDRLRKLRLPVQVQQDGSKTIVIMSPTGAKQLRERLATFSKVAHAKDARLAQAKQPVHYVRDLKVLEKQLKTSEDLFKTMEQLQVDWWHGLPVVLPWLEVDAETLKLLRNGKANTLLVKRMPETAGGVCSIKYLTCMHDGNLEVPLTDMHENEKEMRKKIEDLDVSLYLLGPKGFRARCSVGGTLGSPGENAFALSTAALAGAYRGCENEELHRAIRHDESHRQQLLEVPVVLHPPNTPVQTQKMLQDLFGYPDGSCFEVTEGKLTRAKTPNGWFSNLALPGAIPNENPFIVFEQPEQVQVNAPKAPAYMKPRTTGIQLGRLLEPTQKVSKALQSLMLRFIPDVDEAKIAALKQRASDELNRVGANRRREEGPVEPSQCYMLAFDDKGEVQEMVVIEREERAQFCADRSRYSYHAAVDNMCKSTTEFEVDDNFETGASGLQKALSVDSLDRVALIGFEARETMAWEFKARMHDGKDDLDGDPWKRGQVTADKYNNLPCLRFPTPVDVLIKFTIFPLCKGNLLPVYFNTVTGEEPAGIVDLENEYELPYPLSRSAVDEETDGWKLCSETDKTLAYLVCYPK